jgi:peptidoglycan hydrolase-like protein with peptidoglycan-binding domain
VTKVEEKQRDTPHDSEVEPGPHQPPRRRRVLYWAASGAILVALGAGAWLWTGDTSTEPAPAATGPVASATIGRRTISATETWDGTLDHGRSLTVTSGGQGTVTRIVDQGGAVDRGTKLMYLDEQPVIVLFGAVPMFRDLAPGDSGADVEQLETNLTELGYGGFTVDEEFDESTAEAVRSWHTDTGVDETGTVSRASVVFMPEGGLVDTLHVDVGALVSPGTPILDITGTDLVVSTEVDVDDRDWFEVGAEVTIVLPDGDEVSGKVSAMDVVKVAVADSTVGEEGGSPVAESVAQVEVSLDEKVDADLVGATVDVVVAIDERPDVLVVPVNALLALAEGGYGLEVVHDDGTTSIVAVTTGLFTVGMVEVEGDDIAEGAIVGVAGR